MKTLLFRGCEEHGSFVEGDLIILNDEDTKVFIIKNDLSEKTLVIAESVEIQLAGEWFNYQALCMVSEFDPSGHVKNTKVNITAESYSGYCTPIRNQEASDKQWNILHSLFSASEAKVELVKLILTP